MRKKILLLIVVLLILAGLWAYFTYSGQNPLTSDTTTPPPPPDGLISEEPPIAEEDLPDLTEGMIVERAKTLPNAKTATLALVEGNTGEATAYYSSDDILFYLVVEATLNTPEGEDFYEGWLVGNAEAEEILTTGEFIYSEELGVYQNIFAATDLEILNIYNRFVVTSETVRDETPEAHVLEGTLEAL